MLDFLEKRFNRSTCFIQITNGYAILTRVV